MEQQKTKFVSYRNSVEDINSSVRKDAKGFVLKTEEAYHKNIAEIAQLIAGKNPMCKLVMIAGPSSSGKTTTAHLLKKALEEDGVGCVSISLDDFYRGGNMAPMLSNGKRDYECLEALNVGEIQNCLASLVKNSRCEMPVFDFEQHIPYPHRRQVVLHEREVVVVEGIHALNPVLLSTVPESRVHRIYISVKQGIMDGEKTILGPNDIRLVRRMVRDYNFRRTSPDETLSMWPNVMHGEYKYIKPFRKSADLTINSFHAYELCVLKQQALKLLCTVPESSCNYNTAQNLAGALERFDEVDTPLVPKTSIIREFIGGGLE